MNFFSIMDKKRSGLILSDKEIEFIVKSYLKQDIDVDDMARFMEVMALKNMTDREIVFFTKCMIKLEQKNEKAIHHAVSFCSLGSSFDNCCLLASVMARSCGALVRNIVDRKDVYFDSGVIFQVEEFQKLYNRNFSDILVESLEQSFFSSEDSFSPVRQKIMGYAHFSDIIHSIPYMACNVISKIVHGGSRNLVVNIQVGRGSFFKSVKVAKKFSNVLSKVGMANGVKVICVISDFTVPLGKSFGTIAVVAELADYLKRCQYDKDNRAVVLSLELASYMVGMSCNMEYKEARRMIEANFFGKCLLKGDVLGRLDEEKNLVNKFEFKSPKEGYITNIDMLMIEKLALELGIVCFNCLEDVHFSSFMILNKNVYDDVKRGDVLITLYTNRNLKASIMNNPIFRISKICSPNKEWLIDVVC